MTISRTREEESLFTINLIINLCSNCMDVLAQNNPEAEEDQQKLFLVIRIQIIIHLDSLIDEWNNYFKGSEKIIYFKRKFNPLIKAIESYQDIKKARNTLFAHKRDQNNNYSNPLIDNRDFEYKLPVTIYDLLFIMILLQVLQKELNQHFKTEFNNLNNFRLFSSTKKQVKATFKSKKEVDDAVKQVLQKINSSIYK